MASCSLLLLKASLTSKKKDPHWLAPSSQSHMKVCVTLDAKNLPRCRFSFLKIVALFYTCTADLNFYVRALDGGACENPNAGDRRIHTNREVVVRCAFCTLCNLLIWNGGFPVRHTRVRVSILFHLHFAEFMGDNGHNAMWHIKKKSTDKTA